MKTIKVIIEEGEIQHIKGIPKGTVIEVHYVSDMPDSPIVETYKGGES